MERGGVENTKKKGMAGERGWCLKTPGGFERGLDLIKQTVDQLDSAKDPSEIKIPADVPTCKKNLFRWLSEVCAEMNSTAGSNITHCWEKTKLTKAWEHLVQLTRLRLACDVTILYVPSESNIADWPTRGKLRDVIARVGATSCYMSLPTLRLLSAPWAEVYKEVTA